MGYSYAVVQFIVEAHASLHPVFANEVFVVLRRAGCDDALPPADPHLAALTGRVPELRLETKTESSAPALQPVLPEPGAIFKFSALKPTEFAEAMDQFWLNG